MFRTTKATYCWLLVFVVLSAVPVYAQTTQLQDDEDNQSWNDVQLTVPMSKAFDLQTRATLRFGKDVSRLTDYRFLIGPVWKATKSLSISPFIWLIRARNAAGRFRDEQRLNLQATYRFQFQDFAIVHRSTLERRLRRPLDTWRYRAYLTFEKELPEKLIPKAKFFFGDEVFYDSATDRFSRNRFAIGINKTLSKQVSVDIFYMRQNDGFAHPGDLNVLWVAWRIKL